MNNLEKNLISFSVAEAATLVPFFLGNLDKYNFYDVPIVNKNPDFFATFGAIGFYGILAVGTIMAIKRDFPELLSFNKRYNLYKKRREIKEENQEEVIIPRA
jgi:hypothetical protein